MLIGFYRQALTKRPLLTQMVASGIIAAGGDLLSQFAIEKRTLRTYDPVRTARFCLVISCWVAPVLYRYLKLLERIPGNPKTVPLVRLAIDQALFSPLFTCTVLFNLRILEGRSVSESIASVKRDIFPIQKASWTVWPAAQLFNFYMVPLEHRVIFIQFVALFWNSYLSYKTQEQPPAPASPII